LLGEFGFASLAVSSAEEFLASNCVGNTSCLILDIAMPGIGAVKQAVQSEVSVLDWLHHGLASL